jgi:protein TonB
MNHPSEHLTRAAIEAVEQRRYKPFTLNGEPLEIDTTINVNFQLKK